MDFANTVHHPTRCFLGPGDCSSIAVVPCLLRLEDLRERVRG